MILQVMVLATLLALAPSLLARAATSAQDDVVAEIAQINTSKYPEVTVYVRVVDSGGRLVEGLEQGMFTLTEDGQPVNITEFSAGSHASIATVLTIDRSGSMSVEGKLEGAKEAAKTFIDLMRDQDRVAVVAFDSNVLTVQPFTNERRKLTAAIDSVELGDCTAWYDGVYDSVELIQGMDGRRSVILLSDGIDCREDLIKRLQGAGSSHSLDATIQVAQKAEVPVYTIGLGAQATTRTTNEGYDERKLSRVAAETGGKFYHTPSAAELKALYRELSLGMQKEYVLTYRSPRPTYDGTRRNIGVTISTASGAGASTQSGYLEQHLLNIHSDPLVFLAFLLPLAALLVVPMAPRWFGRFRRSPAPAAEQPQPVTPALGANAQVPVYAQQPVQQTPQPAPSQPPAVAPPYAPVRPTAGPPAAAPAPMAGPNPPAPGAATQLVVRYPLALGPLTIGYGVQCDVLLPGAAPARPVSIIEQRAGRYVVRDLAGGQTFVSFRGDPAQEVPVTENALRDGSTLRCAGSRFVVRAPEGQPAFLEQAFPLRHGFTIGSAPMDTVYLPPEGAQITYAEIVQEGARWVVEDRTGGQLIQISFTGAEGQMRPLAIRNAAKAGTVLSVGRGRRVVQMEFRAG
jgi:VWFA-related protein